MTKDKETAQESSFGARFWAAVRNAFRKGSPRRRRMFSTTGSSCAWNSSGIHNAQNLSSTGRPCDTFIGGGRNIDLADDFTRPR